jgi:hypothetical protein
MTPIRANIDGPFCSTSISAWIAVSPSGRPDSFFGKLAMGSRRASRSVTSKRGVYSRGVLLVDAARNDLEHFVGKGRCRRRRKRLLPDAASAVFTNEHIVSVDLAGKSRPATREIFQSLGFNLTLR